MTFQPSRGCHKSLVVHRVFPSEPLSPSGNKSGRHARLQRGQCVHRPGMGLGRRVGSHDVKCVGQTFFVRDVPGAHHPNVAASGPIEPLVHGVVHSVVRPGRHMAHQASVCGQDIQRVVVGCTIGHDNLQPVPQLGRKRGKRRQGDREGVSVVPGWNQDREVTHVHRGQRRLDISKCVPDVGPSTPNRGWP